MKRLLVIAMALSAAGCPAGGPVITPPVDANGGEGEGEGEGEGGLIDADNDTCAAPIRLENGVVFQMPAFTATPSRFNCSTTNAAGDDGIDDVAFTFVLTATSDVTITADGDQGDGETHASPTLTLFDDPLCAFSTPKVIDERTCVGDGLTFDAPTVMSLQGLPAGTWYIVAETFGDLAPFSIVARF